MSSPAIAHGHRGLARFQKPLALASVITQAGICVTGATVRVTGSGLGCDTWPQCHPGSFTPVPGAAPAVHQAIEFGNRLLTFVLAAVAILLVLSVLKASRRREILVLSFLMPIGIVLQAVVGGITVRLGLTWWSVATHMLLSLLLVFFAGMLYVRIQEPDDWPRHEVVPRAMRPLILFASLVLALTTITGSMVTGAGPHAGDARVTEGDRLQLNIVDLSHMHAQLLYLYVGLLAGIGFVFVLLKVSAGHRRLYYWLLVLTLAQAAVGVLQYNLGVPETLVVLHVAGAATVVALMGALQARCVQRHPLADSAPVT